MQLSGAVVVTPSGPRRGAVVEVDEGTGAIVDVRDLAAGVTPDHAVLVPGFVDLQLNGAADVDVAAARTAEQWRRLDQAVLATGTTTWLPTLVSAPREAYAERIAAVEAAMAGGALGGAVRTTIAGIHLEGPFLAVPGAHPPAVLGPPEPAFLAALPPAVRLVTLAPELPGALGAIEALAARGVLVSCGHTAADGAVLAAAHDAGARLVTHLGNGMPAFHHRRPGPFGAALLHDGLTTTLIGDGRHVAPEVVALAFRAKPAGRAVLVSDRVAGPGVLADGTLAGAVTGLDTGLRFAVSAGVPLEAAVHAASTTPARLLGLADRGRLEAGARADVVALDDALAVRAVWVSGRPAVPDL